MTSPILSLPNELIGNVFDYLRDVENLLSLITVCSRFNSIAESILYRLIFHRSGEAAVALRKAVEAKPERAKHITIIDSRCKWQKREGLISLATVISSATNLRELTIESPYCNNAYGKETELWRSTMSQLLKPICSPLRSYTEHDALLRLKYLDLDPNFKPLLHLRHLTLHLSGSERYWNVEKDLAAIFSHPTLTSVTISCAELHETFLSPLKSAANTPLQHLTLIECNLTVQALGTILSKPKALEVLHIGENCYHKWINAPQLRNKDLPRYVNQICASDPVYFFSALEQQQHSLKTLTYTVKGPSLSQVTLPPESRGLSNHFKLRHVMIDGYCPYFEKALTLPQTAPPGLASLEAKGDMFRLQCNPGLSLADDYQGQIAWTLAAASASPSLRNVRIVSNRTFTNVSPNHRHAVTKLGDAFNGQNVSMHLYKRTFHRHIPPFLHGEQPPTEELVYDTENGFCKELQPSGDRALNDIDF